MTPREQCGDVLCLYCFFFNFLYLVSVHDRHRLPLYDIIFSSWLVLHLARHVFWQSGGGSVSYPQQHCSLQISSALRDRHSSLFHQGGKHRTGQLRFYYDLRRAETLKTSEAVTQTSRQLPASIMYPPLHFFQLSSPPSFFQRIFSLHTAWVSSLKTQKFDVKQEKIIPSHLLWAGSGLTALCFVTINFFYLAPLLKSLDGKGEADMKCVCESVVCVFL